MVCKCLFLTACIIIIIFLFLRVKKISFNKTVLFQKPSRLSAPEYFSTWSSCVEREIFDENPDDFWKNFKGKSRECDKEAEIQKFMKIIRLENRDEKKYAILPIQESSKNVFVTLGIGQDITAEEEFLKQMKNSNQNVTFYGADPIVNGNSELYSKIGKYFPFAVGAKAGFSTASVLLNDDYKNVAVVHVDIYYFLKEVIQENIIDYLWIDAESAEYGILDMFYRNGPFEKQGLLFCQMSLEVHRPDKKQKEQFKEFVKKLIEEKQYGFFFSENVGHMRMWLFNFGSHYCVNKFLD